MTISIIIILVALLITAFAVLHTLHQEPASAFVGLEIDLVSSQTAPIATSGDNLYTAWFTDRNSPNTNGEVFFRASNDGGATFGNKINLSNTNDTDSINAEIAAAGDNNVIVTWWERTNASSNEPVMRISHDNGQTFGPLLKLATNGTIYNNGDTGMISSSQLSEEISRLDR